MSRLDAAPGVMPTTGGASTHPAIKPGALQGYSTKTAPPLAEPAAADAYSGTAATCGTAAANGGNSGSYSYEGTSQMTSSSSNAPSKATTPPAAAAQAMHEAPNAATGAAGAVAGAAAAAGSAVAGAVGGLVRRPPQPAAALMHQHHDRMVVFLASLVTYPFAFLLTQAAAAAGAAGLPGGVGGGSIDTRKRLADFPEGAAIADLESWCREPVYSSWWREVLGRALLLLRELALTYLPYEAVQAALTHPMVLRFLGVPLAGTPPLAELVEGFMPRAQQLLADGAPHVALDELQRRVLPSVEALKASLEARHRLSRGPTPLERLDWITSISRTASFFFFSWLRGLARLCTYISSILSVLSGALSFTVVPSIILSAFSAAAGIGQLLLTGTADLLEPAVNGVLALTETSKDTAASMSGASPVCSRNLPPATVEQLEAFFTGQLAQVSGLINRPEIPRLAGAKQPLLVKAYDLGLIDALGRTEGRAVRELLAAAQSQGVLHMLLRGGSRAAVAATAFDVPGVLAAADELARGLAGRLLPGFVGGGGTYARQLFRRDGFFAYADERQAQMALVLLCRLLSWLHLGSVVAPGSADCLHFVLVLGEAQAGKASLFQQLVAAPPEYAGQLGGSGTSGAPGGLGSGGVTSRSGELKGVFRPTSQAVTHSLAAAGGVPGCPHGDPPAVDMRPLADSANVYVCVFPGLHSHDAATSRLSNSLARTLGGFASAVVFLVHPGSEPAPDKLAVLAGPLAAGRQCLVAINGPGRVKSLAAAAAGGGDAGVVLPGASTPLESLRGRWQAAAEAFCAGRGLPASLLGVVVSELQEEAEVPPGVHKLKQVQDWVVNTVSHAHRMV